jgi:hypothetical protein
MKQHRTLALLAFGCLTLSAPQVFAQQHQSAGAMSQEEIIKSAMSAAPEAIGQKATVVSAAPDGKMQVIRKGTNNFTCMADNPATPGPDPMCMDENALAWATAWLEHKEPPAGKIGFMYMLAGGTDASNTDPFAQKPEANNNWVETGPHVMVVGAKGMMEGYPRSAKPDTSQPYVMWPGTPYEHLMLPVQTTGTGVAAQ